MHDAGLDWSFYDRKFRQLLAKPEEARGTMDWGCLHAESWLKANASKPPRIVQLFVPTQKAGFKKAFIPRGFYVDFHTRKAFCAKPQCSFKHSCFRCKNGSHPAYIFLYLSLHYRTAEVKGRIACFIAENCLPFNMAPKILELCKVICSDKPAPPWSAPQQPTLCHMVLVIISNVSFL